MSLKIVSAIEAGVSHIIYFLAEYRP